MNSHLDLGLLEPFHTAGILDVPDVQVAAALTRVGGRALTDPDDAAVGLGAALCVRALRAGSVCVDLRADPQMWAPDDEQPVPLPWPDPDSWISSAADHPLVAHGPDAAIDRPLRLVGDLLYLQRYWLDEQQIRTSVQQRGQVPSVDAEELGHELRRLFPAPVPIGSVWRRRPPRCVGSRSSPVGPALGRRRQWPGSWLCCAAWHLRLSPWQHPPAKPPHGCRKPWPLRCRAWIRLIRIVWARCPHRRCIGFSAGVQTPGAGSGTTEPIRCRTTW